jgi:hypothetical protein
MKGIILDYSIQTSEGIISGDDNNRYKFAGSEWKETDAPARGQRVDFDISEGRATGVYRELAKTVLGSRIPQPSEIDLNGLPPYYQEEFKKILESGEAYKGKWNWAAFLFGGIWAMTKHLWLSVAICLIAGIATAGFGYLVYWVIYGFRGNYIYYTLYAKKKQLWLGMAGI